MRNEVTAMSRQDWRTPPWLFKLLSKRYGPFAMDAAAAEENTLCSFFSTDGLNDPWINPTFCNPPFKNFGDWVKKAHSEFFDRGVRSCLIGPVGCSQSWFHRYAKDGVILAPTKRICFLLPDGTYPRDEVTGKPTGADRDTMIYLFDYRPVAYGHEFVVRPFLVDENAEEL
jgi:phage N-6-adenine-methyltransferase